MQSSFLSEPSRVPGLPLLLLDFAPDLFLAEPLDLGLPVRDVVVALLVDVGQRPQAVRLVYSVLHGWVVVVAVWVVDYVLLRAVDLLTKILMFLDFLRLLEVTNRTNLFEKIELLADRVRDLHGVLRV
jgi:hypothetical protein